MENKTLNLIESNGRYILTETIVNQVSAPIKSKRQEIILKRLMAQDIDTAMAYLRSFSERRTSIRYDVQVQREKLQRDGTDALAEKKPGSILDRLLAAYDATTSKRPDATKQGEWIGVELECFIPYAGLISVEDYWTTPESEDDDSYFDTHEAGRAARRALAEKVKHARIKNISIKDDGSIECDEAEYFTVEITVLTLIHDKSNLQAICELINSLGAQVNKSTGMHVHLDCRDLTNDKGQISKAKANTRAKRIGNALPLLSKMVPKSRLDNHYCRLAVSAYRGSRYFAVNKTAIDRFGTLEIRLHSGTTDFVKISNWIDLLFLISRARSLGRRTITTQAELVSAVPLISGSLAQYVSERIRNFNRTEATTDGEAAA